MFNQSPALVDNSQETVEEADVSVTGDAQSDKAVWDDEKIDETCKEYLKERRMGKILQPDTLAHLEFFFNTRRLDHQTTNPFDAPELFPALLFKEGENQETVLQVHRRIIIPQDTESVNEQSDVQSVSSIDKKYDWYPNRLIESPFSLVTASPSPKKPTQERRTTQFNLQIKAFDATNGASPLKV